MGAFMSTLSIPSESKSSWEAFTALQGQYLAFIYSYSKLNRRVPAEQDMQRYFRVTPPTVHRMVMELEKRGLDLAPAAPGAQHRAVGPARTVASAGLRG